jgi:hypothetical protein
MCSMMFSFLYIESKCYLHPSEVEGRVLSCQLGLICMAKKHFVCVCVCADHLPLLSIV